MLWVPQCRGLEGKPLHPEVFQPLLLAKLNREPAGKEEMFTESSHGHRLGNEGLT